MSQKNHTDLKMRFHCNAIASFFIFLIIDASCIHCQDDRIEEAATIHVPNPGLVRKGNSGLAEKRAA